MCDCLHGLQLLSWILQYLGVESLNAPFVRIGER